MGYLRGGKILRVNLTTGKVSTEPTGSYADRFIGGKGINVKILFDGAKASVGALDPENQLLFGAGPLVGTTYPAAPLTDVTSRSPVTGGFGNTGFGGYFGAELKFAGYDNLVIEGRAEKPVYLSIRDDEVEIKDASFAWGHDTYETPTLIKQDLGDPGAEVVSIGQAGERMVVYAMINTPLGNCASRTGMGAVMGSKRLKAIAVRGTKGITVAKPKEFLATCMEMRRLAQQSPAFEERHTWAGVRSHDREMRNLYDIMGTAWEGSEVISEPEFDIQHLTCKIGCFGCLAPCFRGYDVPGVGSGIIKCSPPGDLTWDVKIPSMMVAWQAMVQCQKYGLDARSLSNSVAWLMRLHELGIITAADTDGIAMEWGSAEALVSMARKICFREGIGDLIADGLPLAAQKIGKGSENYLIMAKGSPSDLHIPPIRSQYLNAALSPIGEDAMLQSQDRAAAHDFLEAADEAAFQAAIKLRKDMAERVLGIRDAADPRVPEGKAALFRDHQIRLSVQDMVGACTRFGNYFAGGTGAGPSLGLESPTFEAIAKALTLGTGKTITLDDLAQASLRALNVVRAFQAKLGLTREDDQVSKGYPSLMRQDEEKRMMLAPKEGELEWMKDDYYQLMGWDLRTGQLTRSTLVESGLSDIADRLGI